MKYSVIYIITILFITSCSHQEKSNNVINEENPIVTKAKIGDTTLTVLNHIKYDKKEEFNAILFDEVMPACYDYKDTIVEKNQLNKLAFESMRILNPLRVNEDSTWTFIMFADPYFQGALYNIGPPLIQKYGEDSASAIFERWSSCFAQNQVLFFETQQ